MGLVFRDAQRIVHSIVSVDINFVFFVFIFFVSWISYNFLGFDHLLISQMIAGSIGQLVCIMDARNAPDQKVNYELSNE